MAEAIAVESKEDGHDVPVDAFILFNENEEIVEKIVHELTERGVSTYFWRRDIPFGSEWEQIEQQRLREARAVLVFLGDLGWGPNHIQITEDALRLEKRIIPVLIGAPPAGALEKANSLFRSRRYVDLRKMVLEQLDLLAESIFQGRPSGEESAAPRAREVSYPDLDAIMRVLRDGSEESRSEEFAKIPGLPQNKRTALAGLLLKQINGPLSPRNEGQAEASTRDPTKLPSIRSWMLSSLIWADAEGEAARACVLEHLHESSEPHRNVRFWVLAGLVQRRVSYLETAIEICSGDSMPDVAMLARAIAAPGDEKFLGLCRRKLDSTEFAETWHVLRVLRVVAIPELAEDICRILGQERGGKSLAYDGFYALANPAMAQIAAGFLVKDPGVERIVRWIIDIGRESNEIALRNFTILVAQFEVEAVDNVLRKAEEDTATRDIAELLARFLNEYRRVRRRSSTEEPGKSAAVVSPYTRAFPAYSSDLAAFGQRDPNERLKDALDVGTYAGHLAQLIAAKETAMPLSIGLFGAWGAGKSHFIDLLDERLRDIGKEPGEVFHRKIIQIRFNAWHYLDTNLWANLVCEIFDRLFAKLEEKGSGTTEEQVEALKKRLTEQSTLAAEAKIALGTAEKARKEAEVILREAIKARLAQENAVRGMLNDISNLVLGNKEVTEQVKRQLNEVAEDLGLPELKSSFTELEATAKEVQSLSGRAKTVALAVFTGKGWWVLATLLIIALLIPVGVAWLGENGPAFLKRLSEGVAPTITRIVTVISAISVWLQSRMKAGGALVTKLEDAYEKVKKAREKREAEGDAAIARTELSALRQKEEEAKYTLVQAEEKMKEIRAEMAELAPGRQLMRFLKARASADDYRRHLGLVSLVRRDFEQLSDLLTKASKEDDVTLPRIDRIVLYIDDLDRCRADRVIEVLEAVHLLLAFSLFAVVVAVDPRWLRQSLLDHYPRLLGRGEMAEKSQVASRPATPQDYLEKIFQVPFHLQVMDAGGFSALVKQLFPMEKSESPQGQSGAAMKSPAAHPGGSEGERLRTDPQRAAQNPSLPRMEAPPDVQGQPQPSVSQRSGPGGVAAQPQDAVSGEKKQADPKRLTLTAKEVADVERFQPLFHTPRAVKRLANTYCLIRVGVEERDWGSFLGGGNGPGDYRMALLLLAVASARPALARPWLLWLIETGAEKWTLFDAEVQALAGKNRDTTDEEDWKQLAANLDKLKLMDWIQPNKELLRIWVPRVARYSF